MSAALRIPENQTTLQADQGPTRKPDILGRILIADDDQTFCLLLSETLGSEGYHCEGVADGAAALEKLRKRDYDLVITDLEMPGNSDLELVDQIHHRYPGLPVVLVTAHPTIETAARCVGHRISGYLIKPHNQQELSTLVRGCIADSQVDHAILQSQRQLETWGRDLAQIRGMSWRRSGGDAPIPLQAFLKLSLDNLIGALVDFRSLVGTLSQDVQANRSYDAMLLAAAIKETITVLERTRHKHPCEEMADLRRRLERLVEKSAQAFQMPVDHTGEDPQRCCR